MLFPITKRLGASGHGSRERAGHISGRKTGREVGAADVLRQKSRIEAVSCSHRINKIDFHWRASKRLWSSLSQRPVLSLLHYNKGDEIRQSGDGRFQVVGLGDQLCFARIR